MRCICWLTYRRDHAMRGGSADLSPRIISSQSRRSLDGPNSIAGVWVEFVGIHEARLLPKALGGAGVFRGDILAFLVPLAEGPESALRCGAEVLEKSGAKLAAALNWSLKEYWQPARQWRNVS